MDDVPSAQQQSYTRYRVKVVKASEIVWQSQSFLDQLGRNPSPFVEISLDGQQIYATATKSKTLTPVWNEGFDLKSNDPTSILSIKLRNDSIAIVANFIHFNTIPRVSSTSIGSTQLSIQDLEDLDLCSSGDISLDLFEMGEKTAVLAIRITNDQAPAPTVAKPKPSIPVNIPLELRPDFVPPPHPSAPNKKLQFVGYQRQDVSPDQAERIVRQILAVSSAAPEESETGNV